MRAGMLILLPCYAAFSGLAGVPAPRLRRASSPLSLQDVTRPARGDRGTADGQVAARADTYVPSVLYARATRTGLLRATRTRGPPTLTDIHQIFTRGAGQLAPGASRTVRPPSRVPASGAPDHTHRAPSVWYTQVVYTWPGQC